MNEEQFDARVFAYLGRAIPMVATIANGNGYEAPEARQLLVDIRQLFDEVCAITSGKSDVPA